MGRKSLYALILRAPLCGAKNLQRTLTWGTFLLESKKNLDLLKIGIMVCMHGVYGVHAWYFYIKDTLIIQLPSKVQVSDHKKSSLQLSPF